MDRISLWTGLDIEEEDEEEKSCSLSVYLADFACERKEGFAWLVSLSLELHVILFFLFLIWVRW